MQHALELDKQRPPKFIFSAGSVGQEQEDVYLDMSRPIWSQDEMSRHTESGDHRRRHGKTLAPQHSGGNVRQGPCLPDRAQVVEECFRPGEQRAGSNLRGGLG